MKNRTWKVGAVLFAALGIGLVIASTILTQKNFTIGAAICLNIGLATLAVLLVDVVWRLVGGNPLDVSIFELDAQVRQLGATTRAIEQARRVGLEDVFVRQGDFGTQETWENLVRGARKNIDVMARTAFGWSKSHLLQNILSDRISNGVAVRWLMMSRVNRYLKLLEEEDSPSSTLLDGKLVAMEKCLVEIHNRLAADKKPRLRIRTYSHVPLYSAVVRVDDRWYVTHYLFSRASDECPLICVRGEDALWANVYRDEFEFIWNSAQDLVGQATIP